ncbi:hypothetical protein HMPREF1544_01895 [Mucor circinelloides 1006PhL]|uniref:Rab-GAP TBC domain-containing protein n=1 Tax=Mucor circinelloides f. circinelloides (strain 1006PhL) TaxID=1220926 RepID=S2KFN1_MUCC1|nr:hypothetical protein HMPREF1544_01895 [Mucor circinelloides 1006PhL]
MPFWTVEQQNLYFMLQKSQEPGNTIFKNVFSTITNLFDAKQPPYRILFQREPNATCLQIAVSDSQELIEAAWKWISINMIPELEEISSPFAREEWVVKKMNQIVSATTADNETDDLLHDDDIRNASRTFRQTFDVPSSERLVNYYSCSCNSRQGWMYISENYLGFYSYLIGFELKILIELKDIKDIIKEPIRKLFRHSMRIITKENQEYLFANMFKREEVYDLLVQLTGDSVHRLLKNSHSSAFRSSSFEQLSVNDKSIGSSDRRPSEIASNNNPLKHVLEHRKRNENFRQLFRLPQEEELIDTINVCYMFDLEPASFPETLGKTRYPGRLYQSQNFLAFESFDKISANEHDRPLCTFILPLYTITRFERINNNTYRSALLFKTWHKMTHVLKVEAEKTACEQFCDTLKEGLEANVSKMKGALRPFLMTCKSEELIDGPIHVKNTIGGLGLQFGYHSDSTQVKDHKKLTIWKNYFNDNGRNLTLVRQPIFAKMIRAGIPNCLRGEVYEMCSGSIYLRFANQGVYDQILESHKDDRSPSLDDIEKDLHRSLPEYPAYQAPDGIDRLRRVLTAYSWKNPEIGYCQAMNIVTSSLLIYMTEEQAFWTLNSLVDQLCPGYYSSSMYGVLLDQVVLEELVKKYIPKVTEHFQRKEIQLSVACLPWFLTLFINSMPLPFAFRILDCFFMEGPKVLFQIALAILKRHEKELVKVEDDSELLVVVKEFFASLNLPVDDATKEEDDANKLEIFNSLMKSAYSDFPKVTSYKINQLRKQNELKIIGGVESFTKRNALRNIKNNANFGPDEISLIYDYFFGALYYAKDHQDKSSVPEMDLTAFTRMVENMTTWAKLNDNSSTATNDEDLMVVKEVLQAFIQRLFDYFRPENKSGITLQDAVSKLGEILRGDVMSKSAFFFALYDQDKDGELNNIDLHTMSTELFLLMNLLDTDVDKWDVICNFITLSAEQANEQDVVDTLHQQLQDVSATEQQQQQQQKTSPLDSKYFVDHANKIHNAIMGPDAPCIKITLPSLRMIILTEDRLDQLIQTDIPQSFRLQKALVERQKGLGHEIFEALFIEGKKLANNMAAGSSTAAVTSAPSPSVSSERRSLSSIPPPAIPTSKPPSKTSRSSIVGKSEDDEEEFELV